MGASLATGWMVIGLVQWKNATRYVACRPSDVSKKEQAGTSAYCKPFLGEHPSISHRSAYATKAESLEAPYTVDVLKVPMSESSLPDHLVFNGNGGSYPPHGLITATDHGPAVVVATWIMVCLMGLAVIARFGTRQEFGRDSGAICTASVRMPLRLLLQSALAKATKQED